MQGNDAFPSVKVSRELPVIKETAIQDENRKDDEKRTLGQKKQSFGDVSLELRL